MNKQWVVEIDADGVEPGDTFEGDFYNKGGETYGIGYFEVKVIAEYIPVEEESS